MLVAPQQVSNVREAVQSPWAVLSSDVLTCAYVSTCDGKSLPKMKRRLREGRKALDVLSELWAHTGISRRRKAEIYKACVVSKVIYSMESLWLLSSEVKRLDAFHVACLRKISGIKHSYVSRVSNAEVLQQTG